MRQGDCNDSVLDFLCMLGTNCYSFENAHCAFGCVGFVIGQHEFGNLLAL
jgi:hypothetical protein